MENYSSKGLGMQDRFDPILGMSMREFKAKQGMENPSVTKSREMDMRTKIKNMQPPPTRASAKRKAKVKASGLSRNRRLDKMFEEGKAATSENRAALTDIGNFNVPAVLSRLF